MAKSEGSMALLASLLFGISAFVLAVEGQVAARLGTLVFETEETYRTPAKSPQPWTPWHRTFSISRGVTILKAQSCEQVWRDQFVRGESSEDLLGECISARWGDVAASPASGDAWLALAELLAARSRFEQSSAALRNSFATAPYEGWLWQGRLILAATIWDHLPPVMQSRAREELSRLIRTRSRNWNFETWVLADRIGVDPFVLEGIDKMLEGLEPALRTTFGNQLFYYQSTRSP